MVASASSVTASAPGTLAQEGQSGVTSFPAGPATGLYFEPPILNMAPTAVPMPIRVYQRLGNGQSGREVTDDPGLVLSEPSGTVATVTRQPGSPPMVRPVGVGVTRMTATLGGLTTVEPMMINVGGVDGTASMGGQLIATPNPLTMWVGQAITLDRVAIDPGSGQTQFATDYKVTAMPGQGIVTVDPDNKIHAIGVGTTQVMVTPANPQYQSLTAPVQIQVTAPDNLTIQPSEITLQVGEHTQPIALIGAEPRRNSVCRPGFGREHGSQRVVARSDHRDLRGQSHGANQASRHLPRRRPIRYGLGDWPAFHVGCPVRGDSKSAAILMSKSRY